MNAVWAVLWIAGIVYGIIYGRGDELLKAATGAAGDAVALTITLAAAYAFWSGFMNMMSRAGVLKGLSRALAQPIAWLFPGVSPGSEAGAAMATNLAANALGLGNAATPAGLQAAALLSKGTEGKANHALLMFIIVNCTSIQLLPTTLISLRAAAGSASPGIIVLPTLVATSITTAVGITLGVWARRRSR